MEDSQAALIEGARKFDRHILEQIYDTHSPVLYRYAYRLLGRHDAAEDVLSETFTRFLEALHKGKGPKQHLKAYLFRIVHNLCADTYRRQPPVEDTLQDDFEDNSASAPHESAENAVELQAIRSALFRLTPDQRQVVVLRFFEDWDNDEVAAVLGKPIGAVKALQHRALAALKRMVL